MLLSIYTTGAGEGGSVVTLTGAAFIKGNGPPCRFSRAWWQGASISDRPSTRQTKADLRSDWEFWTSYIEHSLVISSTHNSSHSSTEALPLPLLLVAAGLPEGTVKIRPGVSTLPPIERGAKSLPTSPFPTTEEVKRLNSTHCRSLKKYTESPFVRTALLIPSGTPGKKSSIGREEMRETVGKLKWKADPLDNKITDLLS
mmetsp:Transcript_28298/g.55646  ORF Transcript_28298/g.55646 Transcript_28298/m.55646 type:complete len:200 (-) Transcript_28298:427-1026(-)